MLKDRETVLVLHLLKDIGIEVDFDFIPFIFITLYFPVTDSLNENFHKNECL